MYRAIVGIGVLCALLIVGVYQATAGRIRANEPRPCAERVIAGTARGRELVDAGEQSMPKGGLALAPYAASAAAGVSWL